MGFNLEFKGLGALSLEAFALEEFIETFLGQTGASRCVRFPTFRGNLHIVTRLSDREKKSI